MRKLLIGLLAAASLLAARPVAASQVFSTTLVNEVGLTHDSTYALDTLQTSANAFTAEASYSSHTFTDSSFTNGNAAVGSLTVASVSGLVAAAATGTVTINSTTSIAGCGVAVAGVPQIWPGTVLTEGINWKKGANVNATATNLAAALARLPYFASATATSANIALVAKKSGTLYNSVALHSACTDITAPATLTGGANNASVYINGTELRQGRDWNKASSVGATATNIKNAINAHSQLGALVVATTNAGEVDLVSIQDGTTPFLNLSLRSTSTNITRSAATMTGAANPAFAYGAGGKNLRLPSHGYTTGLALLYSEGAGAQMLSGLTAETTYYAVVVDANNIKLADTKAHAVAGTNTITIAAGTGSDLGTNKSYMLAPLAITGTPSFKWQVSTNGSSWSDLDVDSVTVSSYSNPPATKDWDFGAIGYRYIRLNVTGPTTGGLYLVVTMEGTFP